MPTTRQKRKTGEALLPGLPEEKRPKSEKGAASTSGRKPAAKKGKQVLYPHVPCIMEGTNKRLVEKKQEEPPYVALANDLLRRGGELLRSGPPAVGQGFDPPRVWGHRDEPITDPAKLPEGWSLSETDLADE